MNKQLNKNLLKVANILSDGEFHDGTTIGEELQMTRSAVWKTIKKLEENGVKINSVKGKGYALLEPIILLDRAKIKKNIAHSKVDLDVFESVASTNDYLKEFKNNKLIKICLTEKQTSGKGRFNRKWFSPFGKNIYLSCLYPFQKDISELSGLSLIVSLALIKTLKNAGFTDKLFLKWPNDIVYDNKKLSGILVEIQAESQGWCQVVIGVGINVNMREDNDEIGQPWTSLQKISQTYIDRNNLCSEVINNLLDYVQKFEVQGLNPFINEWNREHYLADKKIMLRTMNETISGKVLGINEQGHLLLHLRDGNVRAFPSGETSIVK